jgi:hypothetical protein
MTTERYKNSHTRAFRQGKGMVNGQAATRSGIADVSLCFRLPSYLINALA